MKTASDTPSTPKTLWAGTARPKALATSVAHGQTDIHPGGDTATSRPPEALQPSEVNRRALLNSISDLVFSIRKDGVILECHVPKESAFSFSGEGVVGKRIIELLPIQIARQAVHYLEKALRTGQRQYFACPFLVSGQPRDFEARIAPSGPSEAVAVVRDVTTHKATEKEILEITNREQVRIGQDLHDGLGQHLTGITFLSKALERRLAALGLPEATEAAEIGRLVLQALSQTRSLARGLFPVELESTGLMPAFRELAATVEKFFGISCVVECDEDLVIADRTVATHLFRLVQEAINNSVKHGKAKQVIIALKAEDNDLVLSIQDNGTGFPLESVRAKGLGLRIMNYRAQKIGGSFEIRPVKGGGTIVTCTLQNYLRKD